jgi:hypothetical protein
MVRRCSRRIGADPCPLPAPLQGAGCGLGRRLCAGAGRRRSVWSRCSGAADARQVLLTAVFAAGGGLVVHRCAARPAGAAYPSLTAEHPARRCSSASCGSRPAWCPTGTPGSSRCASRARASSRWTSYPFFTVRGQDVHEVGVGPIHASVIEPGHFRFMCHGEHAAPGDPARLPAPRRRGLLLQRPPHGADALVETVAGDSSIAYAWGYAARWRRWPAWRCRPRWAPARRSRWNWSASPCTWSA